MTFRDGKRLVLHLGRDAAAEDVDAFALAQFRHGRDLGLRVTAVVDPDEANRQPAPFLWHVHATTGVGLEHPELHRGRDERLSSQHHPEFDTVVPTRTSSRDLTCGACHRHAWGPLELEEP